MFDRAGQARPSLELVGALLGLGGMLPGMRESHPFVPPADPTVFKGGRRGGSTKNRRCTERKIEKRRRAKGYGY